MRLDGRTALITGGSQGVGAAIAKALRRPVPTSYFTDFAMTNKLGKPRLHAKFRRSSGMGRR